MVITIRSRKITSGAVDALMHTLDKEFVPIISKEPGFVAYYVIDSGNDSVTAISVFEDSTTSQKSNLLAETWISEHLGHMVPGMADVISGPVMVPSHLS